MSIKNPRPAPAELKLPGTAAASPVSGAVRELSGRCRAAPGAGPVLAQISRAMPRRRVDAGGTRLRLRALHVMGHGSARIARAAGVHPNTIRALVRGDTTTTSPQLRDVITAIYDTWWDKRAPARTRFERGAATAARKRAIARNWCAAAALDDDQLDTPGYRPRQGWKPATGTGVAPDIHPPAPPPSPKEERMRDSRITFELFTDVLGVLHRHGFSRGDDLHAGRAVLLAGDLARIYEGTQDYPYVHRPLHRAPIPPPPEPAGQDNRDPVVLPASDRKTMLIALDIAADDMRNRAGICTGCPDQSCFACESRLSDARAYDQLSDRILQAPEADPAAPRSQREPAGPPNADVRHDSQARPAPDREVGQ
jgi:hypothetical protein